MERLSNPVFISPPRPPRESIGPIKPSSKSQQSFDYGASTTPPRGRRGRKGEEKTPTYNQPNQLQAAFPAIPPPNDAFSQPSFLATIPPPSSPTAQPHLAHQLLEQPPSSPTTGSVPPSQCNPLQIGRRYGLGFSLPIRNRRMTSPAGLYAQKPPRMSLTDFPASPFTSSGVSHPTTFQNGSIPAKYGKGFQIRNPVDLLEVIRAHPEETFTNIRAIGNENIRLKRDLIQLKHEIELNKEKENKQADERQYTIQQLFSVESSMQQVLQLTIDRLEHEVCRLRGGGKVMQGVWLDDEEFAQVSKDVLDGKKSWDTYIFNKCQAYKQATGQISDDADIVKGNRKQDEGSDEANNKQKLSWNPGAQAFVPSVAGSSSSNNSMVTEIFSPSITPSQRAPTTVQPGNDRHSVPPIVTIPPTYASLLHPYANLPPAPKSLAFGTQSKHLAEYPALSTIPTYKDHKRSLRGSRTPSNQISIALDSPVQVPTYAETLQQSAPTPNQPMPDPVLALISDSLPSVLRIICPFSLTGLESCPRSDCTMRRLCCEYNENRENQDIGLRNNAFFKSDDEASPSKKTPTKLGIAQNSSHRETSASPKNLSENTQSWHTPRKNRGSHPNSPSKIAWCSNKRCKNIHVLATCIDDLSEENGGLRTTQVTPNGGTPATPKGRRGKYEVLPKCTNRSKLHRGTRVHVKNAGREEWRVREIVAGLRQAHQAARYS